MCVIICVITEERQKVGISQGMSLFVYQLKIGKKVGMSQEVSPVGSGLGDNEK